MVVVVGEYSSQDDLWDAMSEYPEAKMMLLEIGRQLLLKVDMKAQLLVIWNIVQDNMIDEEKAKKEVAGQMSFQEKLTLLDEQVEAVM